MGATVKLPPAASTVQGPSDGEITQALQVAAAHLEAKRYRQAVELGQRVLQFRKNQPDALHLLGLVAFHTGKVADGERLIQMAFEVAKEPSANLLTNLGNAQREQGKFTEALRSYEQALTLDPQYAPAFFERGILKTYQFDERAALVDFDHVIELRPDDSAAYARATEAMNSLGLFREALAYFEKFIEREPLVPALIWGVKANIHERLSELDKAIAFSEKALALEPKNPEGARVWARAQRRLNGNDPEILKAALARLQSIDMQALTFNQQRGNYDEQAQILDKLKDYDGAFAAFAAMNEVAAREAKIIKIDKDDYLAQVEILIEAADAEIIGRWRELKVPGVAPGHRAPPVFLVGFPRSGTTLLDQIIDAHPDFQVIEEKPLLRLVRDMAQALDGGYPDSLATMGESDRDAMRKAYWAALDAEGADRRNKIVVDKMPLNLIHVGLIARVFPEAKIILALRHPADGVLSCFMQNFQINGSMVNFHTLQDAAHLYDRVMTLWEKSEKLLPISVHEIRYENLIGDLRREVEPLLHFLGAEWNEAQADPAAHARARGTIRTPSYQQVTQPIYSSAADRWRRYEKHVAPVLPLLEKHIRHFGYSL
jgi:tetratricopeptide (TPR) repeat protein